MNKPIEIMVDDFNTALVDLINNSGLPAFIITQSLQAALNDVSRIAEQNLQKARESYKESEVTDHG